MATAILGEKETRLLQDKALRNDGLRKLVLSLRAERSNLKGFQFHRELLMSTIRTKSYLVNNAIKEFIDVNEWQIHEITRTVYEADQPGAKFSGHKEVSPWLNTWGSKNEKDPPKCK